MEEIVYGEHAFQIPVGLKEGSSFPYFLEIISPDTWNNVLTDTHRQQLMKFLPDFPDEDLKNKTQTLELYFMNENFFFGSPLQKFFTNLNKGFFNPNIAKQRKINRKILLKSYRYRQKQYYHKLLEEMVISRKNLIDGVRTCGSLPDTLLIRPPSTKMDRREACIQRARKRYIRELKAIKTEAGCDSEMSEDENYPEGPGMSINKKQRRQLALLETSFPSTLCLVRGTFSRGSLALDLEARFNSFENPFDTSDEHLRHIIANHISKRKKNSIATAVRGVTMHGVLERTQLYSKKPLQRPHSLSLQLPSSDKPSALPNAKKSSFLRKKLKPVLKEKLSYNFSVPPALGRDLCVKSNGIPAAIKEISSEESSSEEETENFDQIKTEEADISKNLQDERSLFAPELTQETHISFFSLLRDVICSTAHQRMSKQQLENSIKNWQDSAISPLNEWFCLSESWVENLPSSINFLCGNLSVDILPSDFVPFIEHKVNSKCFQWIGAGRDTDSNLEPLCQFWLSNRNGIINIWPTAVSNTVTKEETKSSVTKNVTTPGWNLSPTVASPDNEYHVQERLRYGSPHKAFTYRMNGYESIIGPVKGVYSQQVGSSSKARDHTLLISNRPPYVTILSLVWDAVSRLPNGEGTKIDICKLVKESQFIIQISSSSLESTLTNVVSGALDRLQNEKDPCVKFDTSRKLWVYLHSNRTEEEFERIHHMNGPLSGSKVKNLGSGRKQKSKKEDLEKGPPNVAMEQFSSAIKQMDGSEVRVKDEDLLKNWVKISTAPMKKNETVKITSSQLRADLAKMKAANAKAAAAENAVDGNNLVSKNQQLSFKTPLVQSAPVKKIAVSPTPISNNIVPVPQIISPTEEATNSTPTSKTCTTLQFAKRAKLIQSAPSNTISTKPTVNTQGARKYHSASEKKRQTGILPGAVPSTTTVSESHTPTSTSTSDAKVAINSAEVTPVPGIKVLQYSSQNVQGGRFIQIAAVDSGTSSGFQKVTLVPQFTQASITNTVQKGVDVTKKFASTGIKTTMASGELKLKLRGPTTFTTASGNITGNLISLGGKQIFLATKGSTTNKPNTQFQQVVVGEAGTARIENVRRTLGSVQQLHIAQNTGVQSTSSGQPVFVSTTTHPTQQHIIVPVSTTGQQIVVPATNQQIVVPANAGGQQIMVPASALHGSQINLKRLQAFQSFKVVPASHLTTQQKGKPMVAHILAPSTSQTARSGTTKLSLHLTKDGQAFERK